MRLRSLFPKNRLPLLILFSIFRVGVTQQCRVILSLRRSGKGLVLRAKHERRRDAHAAGESSRH